MGAGVSLSSKKTVKCVISFETVCRVDPRPSRGLNVNVTSFPAKVHPTSHLFEVGKKSTSIHGPHQKRLSDAPI